MFLIPVKLLLLSASLAAGLAGQTGGKQGDWRMARPEALGLDRERLETASGYASRAGGAGVVIYRGQAVHQWGDVHARHEIKSSTKSIGSLVLGLALRDGKVNLDDRLGRWMPEFLEPAGDSRERDWREQVKLIHLATHTSGLEKPGGFARVGFEPGTRWQYSDGGPNWLADALTRAYRRDLEELLFERVFPWIGVTRDEFQWRGNAYRPPLLDGVARREFGSGVSASADALARIGFLFLRGGGVGNRRVLPSEFVSRLRAVPVGLRDLAVEREELYPRASQHYGLLWWNNADGAIPGAPRDLYWSWGLHDSVIAVIPSLDLLVTRVGGSLAERGRENSADFARLRPLIEPVVAAVPAAEREVGAPYPPSPKIAGIDWAPLEEIRRAAPDCDNWPMTWTDDDKIVAACGDGRGFAPFTPRKMGLLLTEIEGDARSFTGRNLKTSLDNTGMGAEGLKASGLLMVDGILYIWLRNAGNAQLAWSEDRGRSWTLAPWKFQESFGHPSFLNFGRNYSGARDEFVYIYSPDSNTAYEAVPRLVLARAPKRRLRDPRAYEYFVKLSGGRARWTRSLRERGAVFENGRDLCYRTQVSYHAPSGRYLLVYAIQGPVNSRFQGGLGVFDAPAPWGPWTTVHYTRLWDSAPGESLSFPVKWMEADGRTVHLASSSDDALSVRRAVLRIKPQENP